ncbi:predicted protein [Phaeodactylum tricornutum CCAP 1055/1]|uniref:Transmembrane protein n=2 Tax=Phaeodactylum tricornutum TaxID=2850 RepID=B7FTT0_PHATC|nr:predicted protein [Phaeodactylum tricornutum CCAP 1055/1]EEC50137.1 predicted protein [Phaeodactylum tricornutum CCAP 1055/1]|eukprot:XP_002178472.1 predicted protein [Phaeodactylum tricornutum CCAP 1055/1]
MVSFCPYGPFLSLPAFSVLVATICTWVATFDCSFFRISNVSDRGESISIGLWTIEYFETYETVIWGETRTSTLGDGECVLWSKNSGAGVSDLDAPLWIARIFSLVASLASIPLLVAILAPSCMTFSSTFFRRLSIALISEGVCTLISLSAIRSKWCLDGEDCTIRFSGILCLLAVLFWFIAGCTSVCLKESAFLLSVFFNTL